MRAPTVLFFDDPHSPRGDDAVRLLGLKAASLHSMARSRLPVPPGFTTTTAACEQFFARGERLSEVFRRALRRGLARLRRVAPDRPLSVSVRTSAPRPVLGLMPTALDVGPDDLAGRVERLVETAFRSWDGDTARAYRRRERVPDRSAAVAVVVQAMVFGDADVDSGAGRASTRDPATGDDRLVAEFLTNARGSDLAAGDRPPLRDREIPRPVVRHLVDIKRRLERCYRDAQDFEFTVERGRLYLLRTRDCRCTVRAAVKVAADMVRQRLIDEKTALLRIDPAGLDQLLHPTLDPAAPKDVVASGLPASPGAASGRIAFSAADARDRVHEGEPIILVHSETGPADVVAMQDCEGILTSTGGMTSHAAVVGRGLGIPCVVGAGTLRIDPARRSLHIGGRRFGPEDWLTIDGSSGDVIAGCVPTAEAELTAPLRRLLGWADRYRRLGVRANADTPRDALRARRLGAEGIGLCRTEHMFFGRDRIAVFQEMILAAAVPRAVDARDPRAASAGEMRKRALAKLLSLQRADFVAIFEAMKGLPVTIRLLDPPLHEFLPHGEREQSELARTLGLTAEEVRSRVARLHEVNPMLGHRGDRLAVTFPEILEMQVRAIIEAAVECKRRGVRVVPEIMVPLVGTVKELEYLKRFTTETAERVMAERKTRVEYLYGTMIEVPRAALTADELAREAEFFSFGTNDLTQMTFGFSRDDANSFLPDYLSKRILERDPFQSIDVAGVGQLVRLAVEKGRKTRPSLKLGICGEHGGDPRSIRFCHDAGLTYVSCSPFRVPIARLAAAQAAIAQKKSGRPAPLPLPRTREVTAQRLVEG